MAIDSNGDPRISYLTPDKLQFAAWRRWHVGATETVDSSAGYVGVYASLALDKGGIPHISYYAETAGMLKVAELSGSN